MKSLLFTGFILLYILGNIGFIQSKTFYVDTNNPQAKDTNPGSEILPWKTLQQAADNVTAGDTIIVGDGVYNSSNWYILHLIHAGNSSDWITFKSKNKWGAKLDGRNNSNPYGLVVEAQYNKFQDFELSGIGKLGIDLSVNNSEITGNNIHNIGNRCSNESVGLSGIYSASASSAIIQDNVIHEIGRYGPNEQGCSPNNTGYKNLDHGIYLNGVSHFIIQNNLFFLNGHGWGIQVYSGSGLYSSDVVISSNTFAFPNPYRDGQIILSCPGASNIIIQNNIFYNPRNAGVRIDTTTCPASFSNVSLNNNLVFNGTINSGISTGISMRNNLEYTDPGFTDPEAHNFQLQAESAAIDAGVNISLLEDILGNTRPQGNGWDVGAYEYPSQTAVPFTVTINSPTTTDYASGAIPITILINKEGYCEFSLTNGETNFTLSTNDHLNFTSTIANLTFGDYSLTSYCNDSQGDMNYTEGVTFSVNENQSVSSIKNADLSGGGSSSKTEGNNMKNGANHTNNSSTVTLLENKSGPLEPPQDIPLQTKINPEEKTNQTLEEIKNDKTPVIPIVLQHPNLTAAILGILIAAGIIYWINARQRGFG